MGSRARILFVGPLIAGRNEDLRTRALETLGCDLLRFSYSRYFDAGPRWLHRARNRLSWGPGIAELNRDLVAAAAEAEEYDLAWVTKGVWLYPETVRALGRGGRARVIHFTPDSQLRVNRTRHFVRSIPEYDLLITTKPWEVEAYRHRGAREVLCCPQAISLERFRPYELTDQERRDLGSDICFVGRSELHYVETVGMLAREGFDVAVWGDWQRRLWRRPWLKGVYRGSGIWQEEYPKAICAAKVGLGLLSRYVGDTATTRTFEIPACGTLLLAERTEEHQRLFEEGREAEFFDGPDELREKLRYYLEHDADRERVAAAGLERVRADGHDNLTRMGQILDAILG